MNLCFGDCWYGISLRLWAHRRCTKSVTLALPSSTACNFEVLERDACFEPGNCSRLYQRRLWHGQVHLPRQSNIAGLFHRGSDPNKCKRQRILRATLPQYVCLWTKAKCKKHVGWGDVHTCTKYARGQKGWNIYVGYAEYAGCVRILRHMKNGREMWSTYLRKKIRFMIILCYLYFV
jgi:hypothetical protein